jgi:hypothetical protein
MHNVEPEKMRWMRRLAYVLLTALILFGIGGGYPLQGSNGAVNCTIFGIFKDPWSTGNINADRYSVLNIDLSLTRANNSSDITPIPAAFSLTDGNDRVYRMSPEYTREFQFGRRLIGFMVPKETIAKGLTVDLSANRAGGEQFTIPFPGLSNSSDLLVTLLYYGVLNSWTDSNKRTFEFDISVSNNGTKKLSLGARNFSLIDQWGWRYSGRDRDSYGRTGFPAVVLEPNQTIRSGLLFSSLSPLSRPVELVYQYSGNRSLAINIDSEAGLDSRVAAPQSCDECGSPSQEPAPSSLAGSIKASKARLAKVK